MKLLCQLARNILEQYKLLMQSLHRQEEGHCPLHLEMKTFKQFIHNTMIHDHLY